jgi:hypothetical protein
MPPSTCSTLSGTGRPRVVGRRLPNLSEQLASRDTRWHRLQITGWFGLFSLVALWAPRHGTAELASPWRASRYSKPLPTFADALAAVRRALWQSMISNTSPNASDTVKMPRVVLNRLTDLACYPA